MWKRVLKIMLARSCRWYEAIRANISVNSTPNRAASAEMIYFW